MRVYDKIACAKHYKEQEQNANKEKKANENIFEERTETKHCTNTAETVQSVKNKHNNRQHTHMPYTNVIYVLTVI